MEAKNIKDIAEYVILECQNNIGVPEYASDAMHGFWNVVDDVRLAFGKFAGRGLWEVDIDYRVWIADQVEFYLKTHNVSGISFKA